MNNTFKPFLSFMRQVRASQCLLHVLLLLLLMSAFGILAVLLGQDANWDLRNYHWYNAYAFLHHRLDWDIDPAQLQNYFNPLLDVLNFFIVKHASKPIIAEFLLGAFHGVAVYFFLQIAFIVLQGEPLRLRIFFAFLAVVLGVTGVASFPQIGTTFNESQITLFIMAALFLALKAIAERNNETGRFFLWISSGFVIGLGFGLKLTAISYVVGFFAAICFHFLFFDRQRKSFFKLIGGIIVFFILGFLLTDGFWLWTLYHKFHNPFFPMYNRVFHSPYVNTVGDFVDKRFIAKDLKSIVSFPFSGMIENSPLHPVMSPYRPEVDRRLAVVFILGLLAVFFNLGTKKWWYVQQLLLKKRDFKPRQVLSNQQVLGFLLIFFLVSYLVWIVKFGIFRYFISINLLSGLLIIYFCLLIFHSTIWRLIAVVGISSWVLFTTVQPELERIHYGENFFSVKVPTIPDHSVIILLGSEDPLSYFIPYFPPETKFVGFYNMIVRPENTVLYQQAVDAILKKNQPLYVMTSPNALNQHKSELTQFGIKVDSCFPIKTNMKSTPAPVLCSLSFNHALVEKIDPNKVTEFNLGLLYSQRSYVDSQKILRGSYPIELGDGGLYVWISRIAEIRLMRNAKSSSLRVSGYIPYSFHQKVEPKLAFLETKIFVNNHIVKTEKFTHDTAFNIKIYPAEFNSFIGNNPFFNVRIELNNEIIPADRGLGNDKRRLAMILGYIGQE